MTKENLKLIADAGVQSKPVTYLGVNDENFSFAPDFFEYLSVKDVYNILNAWYEEKKSDKLRSDYFVKLKKSGKPFNPFADVNAYRQYMLQFLTKRAAGEGWAYDPRIDHLWRLIVELTAYFGGFHDKLTTLQGVDSEGRLRKKGILIIGPKGTGKTFLLKAFMKNPWQGFVCRTAKQLQKMVRDGDNAGFDKVTMRWITDHARGEYFNQDKLGLMIDDIGTEDDVNDFGNRKNIILDIIWERAESPTFRQSATPHLFLTTNLSSDQLQQRYGERAWDRMQEMLNIYPLNPNLESLRN